MIKERKYCTRYPFHYIELIHTELEDGTSKDYCPECQELFGEKIWYFIGKIGKLQSSEQYFKPRK